MLSAIGDTAGKIHEEIETLTREMSDVRIEESTIENLFVEFQDSHKREISHLSFQLETILLQQEAVKVSSDVLRTKMLRDKVRGSLAFAYMHARRTQISKAKSDTYDWILGGGNQNSAALGGFLEWLDDPHPANNMFWISGKPGSGKSTLLRYLDMNVDAFKCRRWLSQKDLYICRFFVWNPGEALQKSFKGLLQAVLHQILSVCKWLTEIAISDERICATELTDTGLEWTLHELERTFADCLSRASITAKIFILLDGLDELQGNDQDRQDMLDYLRGLSTIDNVKICVSSRPWNIFNDFFRNLPTIRIQDFTRPDIENYVRYSLWESISVQSTYIRDSGEASQLVEAIISKADGVFLWVRLVVDQLLRGFRDGETIRTLKRKVDSLPPDLDGFFHRIIESIEPAYRREGSAYLQTAIFAIQDEQITWPRGLLEYTFLEHEDPSFAMTSSFDFDELRLDNIDALAYRIDWGKRRLNSRCMGLLECTQSSLPVIINKYAEKSENARTMLLCTDVNLLHRSLMDYLMTSEAQLVLHRHTGGLFESRQFLCNALLVKICALTKYLSRSAVSALHLRDPTTILLADQTHSLLLALADYHNLDTAILWSFLRLLEPTLQLLKEMITFDKREVEIGTLVLVRFLRRLKSSDHLLLAVAVHYNLEHVVKHYIPADHLSRDQKAELLEVALSDISTQTSRKVVLVQWLLENGADPNMPISSSYTIWHKYLDTAQRIMSSDLLTPQILALIKIIAILIQHGAEMQCVTGSSYSAPITLSQWVEARQRLIRRNHNPSRHGVDGYRDYTAELEAFESLESVIHEVEMGKPHAKGQTDKKRKQSDSTEDTKRQRLLKLPTSRDSP